MRAIDNEGFLTTAHSRLHDDEIRELYAYPTDPSSPWIRMNFVSSIDGAVTSDGTSGALGTPADRRLFTLLRELADVVVVGAGTVRSENYGGAKPDAATRDRRLARGQASVPPIAVVTTSAHIHPRSRLLTDTDVPPIVITGRAAPEDRVQALVAAGADVVRVDDDAVPTSALLASLAERNLNRVLCEGGPSLFGQLLRDDAVDELCLTTSPMLIAGSAGRIASSPSSSPRPMRRAHVLADDDGTILTRWVRERPGRL
ncbi:pyrimidine reductase family protein [Rhodococcus sp. Q]|uniref:pyrimidine reductase family protein n=1 Tax=Rhodococcus sp. Q TaxID=2502252 RepID=UPI0010F452DD|nr:pyrimidine reductase family protein [Rhodococcus sp. Q]